MRWLYATWVEKSQRPPLLDPMEEDAPHTAEKRPRDGRSPKRELNKRFCDLARRPVPPARPLPPLVGALGEDVDKSSGAGSVGGSENGGPGSGPGAANSGNLQAMSSARTKKTEFISSEHFAGDN